MKPLRVLVVGDNAIVAPVRCRICSSAAHLPATDPQDAVFLQKPFREQQLAHAMRRVFNATDAAR